MESENDSRQLGICIHSPYFMNDEKLEIFIQQLIVVGGSMELILVDNYTARPYQRDQTDLFIDLKLIKDDMENIPMKFIKLDAEMFILCMQQSFGISVQDQSNIEAQIHSLFTNNNNGNFKIHIHHFTFLLLENQQFPCLYIQNNLNVTKIKEINDKNKDEIILLIQNYVDFLEGLHSTQIQYMILRVFEDFTDQSGQILNIIKDYIEALQFDDEYNDNLLQTKDSNAYEEVQVNLNSFETIQDQLNRK